MRAIQRNMAIVAATVVVWSSLLILLGRAEEAGAKEAELPYQVREIFHRHCLECHGNAAKGEIRLLDRALLVEQRHVVRLGSPPEKSELFDLVAGGSMPPGNRPKVPAEEQAVLWSWIQAGAPPLPSDADEAYVLWSIVRDLRAQPDEQKPFVRYLSLNHLAGRDGKLLDRERQALSDMLHYLTAEKGKQPVPKPIEATGTVFRIDLQELGWDLPPYPDEQLNLFDLILLEYPYGSLPIRSPFYPELAHFLRTAKQIRPISYVRADWLVREVSRPPLLPDFLHKLDKDMKSAPPQTVRTLPDLPAWAQTVVGDIVPLDGLTYRSHKSNDPQFVVEFKAIHWKDRKKDKPDEPKNFFTDDQMALWFKTNKDADIELVLTDKGRKQALLFPPLKGGKARMFPQEKGVVVKLAPGVEQESEEFTIYAYPLADLDALKLNFPRGKPLHADGVNNRVIHPLYELRADGNGFKPPDAGKMVKVTITVTTRRKQD